jgi:hypothetical protein
LKISAFFDGSFEKRFGVKSKATIQKILALAQNLPKEKVTFQIDNLLPIKDANLDASEDGL